MTFHKISVLVPTRRRIARLERLLASYDQTTQRDRATSELVFRIDTDDEPTAASLRGTGHTVVVGPRLQGYGSMAAFFAGAAVGAAGDVFMLGNDDMVFHTDGWATRILAVANEYPDGLFDIGVRTHNETHFPFSIISRRVTEHLGFVWDPRVFWGDVFWRDVMDAILRTRMVPSVRIDHEWIGHNPDSVYMEGLPYKAVVENDPSYWTRVHAPAVQEAVMRLGELA